MDFIQALKKMEEGKAIRKTEWKGYLFLDKDSNVRHAGEYSKHEEFWRFDTHEDTWEEHMEVNLNSEEVTASRLESMMDGNQSQTKRLYYLEEIIEGQHRAFKKIVDNVNSEMDETRNALAIMVKSLPSIEKTIKELILDRAEIKKEYLELKLLKQDVKKLIDLVDKKLEVKAAKEEDRVTKAKKDILKLEKRLTIKKDDTSVK